MINENTSIKIYDTIRSFQYKIIMYDDAGNKVFDNKLAKLFYVVELSSMISLLDIDSSDDILRVNLSSGQKIDDIQDFLDRLKAISKEYGLIYNIRRFNKILKPSDFKDLTNDLSESRLYGSTKSSYEDFGPLKLIYRHDSTINPESRGSRSRNIKNIYLQDQIGQRFRFDVPYLRGARAYARHMANSGNPYDEVSEKVKNVSKQTVEIKNLIRTIKSLRSSDLLLNQFIRWLKEIKDQNNSILYNVSKKRGYELNIQNLSPLVLTNKSKYKEVESELLDFYISNIVTKNEQIVRLSKILEDIITVINNNEQPPFDKKDFIIQSFRFLNNCVTKNNQNVESDNDAYLALDENDKVLESIINSNIQNEKIRGFINMSKQKIRESNYPDNMDFSYIDGDDNYDELQEQFEEELPSVVKTFIDESLDSLMDSFNNGYYSDVSGGFQDLTSDIAYTALKNAVYEDSDREMFDSKYLIDEASSEIIKYLTQIGKNELIPYVKPSASKDSPINEFKKLDEWFSGFNPTVILEKVKEEELTKIKNKKRQILEFKNKIRKAKSNRIILENKIKRDNTDKMFVVATSIVECIDNNNVNLALSVLDRLDNNNKKTLLETVKTYWNNDIFEKIKKITSVEEQKETKVTLKNARLNEYRTLAGITSDMPEQTFELVPGDSISAYNEETGDTIDLVFAGKSMIENIGRFYYNESGEEQMATFHLLDGRAAGRYPLTGFSLQFKEDEISQDDFGLGDDLADEPLTEPEVDGLSDDLDADDTFEPTNFEDESNLDLADDYDQEEVNYDQDMPVDSITEPELDFEPTEQNYEYDLLDDGSMVVYDPDNNEYNLDSDLANELSSELEFAEHYGEDKNEIIRDFIEKHNG